MLYRKLNSNTAHLFARDGSRELMCGLVGRRPYYTGGGMWVPDQSDDRALPYYQPLTSSRDPLLTGLASIKVRSVATGQ